MSDPTLIPSRFVDITPSDTTPVSTTIGIRVGGAGTIVIKNLDSTTVTLTVTAGEVLSGRFYIVMAASTATLLVGLYAT